jgi:hypothetical protein
MHDIPHAVFHVDRGLIPTLNALIARPGAVINEYLDGKRIKYFNPLTLTAMIAGVYALVFSFEAVWLLLAKPWGATFDDYSRQIMLIVSRFYSLMLTLLVPATALGNWVMFSKAGRTFAEHLVTACFLTAASTLILIIPTVPLAFALDAAFGNTAPWIGFATWAVGMFASMCYNTYGLAKVFSTHYSLWSGANRASVALLISLIPAGFAGLVVSMAVRFWMKA